MVFPHMVWYYFVWSHLWLCHCIHTPPCGPASTDLCSDWNSGIDWRTHQLKGKQLLEPLIWTYHFHRAMEHAWLLYTRYYKKTHLLFIAILTTNLHKTGTQWQRFVDGTGPGQSGEIMLQVWLSCLCRTWIEHEGLDCIGVSTFVFKVLCSRSLS